MQKRKEPSQHKTQKEYTAIILSQPHTLLKPTTVLVTEELKRPKISYSIIQEKREKKNQLQNIEATKPTRIGFFENMGRRGLGEIS